MTAITQTGGELVAFDDDQPHTLMTIGLEEAAAILRMAPSTLRKRAAAGKVRAYKPGRQWVFLQHEIAAYLQASATVCRPIDVRMLRTDERWRLGRAGSDLARKLHVELTALRKRKASS